MWCYERCHKPEMAGLRQSLQEMAQQMGFSLICIKKGMKLGAWLSTSRRRPYVLLTVWREAQPCIQTLVVQPAFVRPFVTIVVCDTDSQCVRAIQWTRYLDPKLGTVSPVLRHSIPAEVFGGRLRAVYESEGRALTNNSELAEQEEEDPDVAELPPGHQAFPELSLPPGLPPPDTINDAQFHLDIWMGMPGMRMPWDMAATVPLGNSSSQDDEWGSYYSFGGSDWSTDCSTGPLAAAAVQKGKGRNKGETLGQVAERGHPVTPFISRVTEDGDDVTGQHRISVISL